MGEAVHRYDETMPLEYRTEENRLNILGFWIFLGAEVVLFATLFATYLVLFQRTGSGPTAQELFQVKDVLIETLLLLTSSFTCGLAIFEMRRGRLAGLLAWLLVTLLLGIGFITFEVREFIHYVHEGATMQTSAFLSSFFVLVGTHGAHVSLGIGWMIFIIIQLLQRGLTVKTARKVFIVSLYWHFLDVVWIFIFTLVYLLGMVV
ncbi:MULTISPECIES: cytochrome aa3 quinol oxidase subunit III [Geobacillus]|jgi:cytochrome aa3-600 menaquinol oxidase subunit III|uniref:Quinol oxidase subunit 3 n=2 Tax=Geobacillus thermodenitrificans TaxID=33940 RepID=A4ITS2_GEOTN|nr:MULTISPECIES: cytochrome aa3 quinol oxidase subunit III [Geobacillus]ABO68726.1 Cytochrome aa3 quinol oxidase polypeptide III [Geobacillus thermodenitrificans NG80-2]ARA98198.1 cytochrome aa3 quinol oxidase subunit III [Geobacillus thermodenitrificans]ARP44465.1 Quinol oxidase subunit 3 [Geobacillus thermodenitrificans]ATO37558.1 cytochrome aa3 quinol oxidase subunit III [Geobacillus thermodenitrificans]KQB91497.1 Quinol oxidase subunit 3 [Geobacillus sp. PA-3]